MRAVCAACKQHRLLNTSGLQHSAWLAPAASSQWGVPGRAGRLPRADRLLLRLLRLLRLRGARRRRVAGRGPRAGLRHVAGGASLAGWRVRGPAVHGPLQGASVGRAAQVRQRNSQLGAGIEYSCSLLAPPRGTAHLLRLEALRSSREAGSRAGAQVRMWPMLRTIAPEGPEATHTWPQPHAAPQACLWHDAGNPRQRPEEQHEQHHCRGAFSNGVGRQEVGTAAQSLAGRRRGGAEVRGQRRRAHPR